MHCINIICRRMSDDGEKEVIKSFNELKGIADATVFRQQLISVDDTMEPYDVSVIKVMFDNKKSMLEIMILYNALGYRCKLIDGEWYLF